MSDPISCSSGSTFGLWRYRKCVNCRLLAGAMPRKKPENSPQRDGTVRLSFRAWSNVDPEMRYTIGLLLLACTLIAGLSTVSAQDIEPRSYSNAPVGVNFLIAGYAYTRGGLSLDPSLPVTNAKIKTSNAILAYVRVQDHGSMFLKETSDRKRRVSE